MRPYHQTATQTFYHGDVLTVLQTMPADSVHCCVTSPPYWALRDYRVTAMQIDKTDRNDARGTRTGTSCTMTAPATSTTTGWASTGWASTCTHDAEPEQGTVLDPFLGSGTTAWVATRLGRKAIGIDLNAEYLDLAVERNRQQGLL